MSRKLCSLLLAISVMISTVAIAAADEAAVQAVTPADYAAASAALQEQGVDPVADTGVRAARLLQQTQLADHESGVALSQLPFFALEQEALAKADAQAARQQVAENLWLLNDYDGVELASDVTVYSDLGQSDSGYSIPAGKVALLTGIDDSGEWYSISFDEHSGYVAAWACTPVHYSDYSDSDAILSDETIAQREAEEKAAAAAAASSSYSAPAFGSGVVPGDSSLRQAIVDYAYTYLGTPYSYGGASRAGVDCSGFTMIVFGYYGISLTHGATGQYYQSMDISSSQLQAGDLVFFHCGYSGIGHVGLYVGGGSFIHASNSGVQIDSLYSGYWVSNYCVSGGIVDG